MIKHFLPYSVNLFTLLLCGCCYTFAQPNLKHYTATDGLAHDVTYNIFQDSKGYIWIGTDDGLSKFDGKQFANYGLKNGLTSNYVMDVKELKEYSLVISTWGGGLHFLKNDTIFKSLHFNDNKAKIYDIAINDNTIYAQSGSRFLFYHLKDSSFTKQIFDDKKQFRAEDPNMVSFENVAISNLGNQFVVHDQGSTQQQLLGVKGLEKNKPTRSFAFLDSIPISEAVKIDAQQYVFASRNQLIFASSNAVEATNVVSSVSENEKIVKIFQSPNNQDIYFLIAKDAYGFKRLYQFNRCTQVSDDLLKKLRIKTTISDAIFDFEGNLWITTYGNGVYCYYYSNPKIKNLLEGNYIVDLKRFNNHTYALTPSKLFKFFNEEIVATYPISGFAKTMTVTADSLYVSSLKAIPSKNNMDFKLVDGRFFYKSNHGTVTQGYLIKLDGQVLKNDNEIVISAVEDTQDKLTFFTNKGKWKYLSETKKIVPDSVFNTRVYGDRIQGYKKQKAGYFIYTDKGLLLVQNDSIITRYDERNGIQNERINDLFIDKHLYLATQGGLSVIKDDQVSNFSKSYGLSSLAINRIVAASDKLWLGGDNGISIIDRNSLKQTPSPKINIRQYDHTFSYDVISFETAGIQVEYRLNNRDWVQLNPNEKSIDFSSYANDHYEVLFRARKDHSAWGYSSNYSFKISPIWYQRWWVMAVIAVVVIISSGGLFYYRIRVIAKRNTILQNAITKRIVAEKELSEVRDNIARDFHDDLGNKLASISLLSDLLSKKVGVANRNLMKSIKADADHLYKGTKDFIFSLQEKSNYLDEVRIYLSDFAEDYLYQFGISFEMETTIKKEVKLPYYWSKQIIFIFKEAITNTAKHAQAKNTVMSFDCQNGNLIIVFKDDGCGFDLDEITMNGLTNMKTRANKINCQLLLHTRKDNGTYITFKGKLPQEGSVGS
ncbi:two-component regulator propeller domain-containing protein [Spongiivirga sp. MCCC 1A20706]|uniref:sensor histidine kinase n=1 Tax=Spongiivirga sp. MCCC 1A20706 TaxID=3160963 RepID=UPI003977A0CC